MANEIEQLSIKIEADAKSAISSINSLAKKLDALSISLGKVNGSSLNGLANGVQRLGTAMQTMNGVKTADFTRLASNLTKLSNINVSAINSSASSISVLGKAFNNLGAVSANAQSISDLAKALSKLGYKTVTQATTNIPALAASLKGLMQTLSTAPAVSRNVIDMANALANLASQGSKIGSASTSMVKGLNGTSVAMVSAQKRTTSLASAFGKFYASYFWIIRGFKQLWKSVKSSMDYIEVLNYFDEAFGQVAESAVANFEQAGYDSADGYYKSFSDRAKQLTSKMTGFAMTENGTMQATGENSLGINPSELMQYQAMFGQMASSIGVTGENALKLSQALTEIGGDLASIRNLDFTQVWGDMASGLAGMSRTLDKYGVNIRNVNLQQKLFDIGINESVTNLNQNEKALLRTIILLENTKYAWGDLGETINYPANQLRLLNSGFENLGRIIGNMFLPLVSSVLPVLNGLVISLQRLFTWLSNLMGIDLSGLMGGIGSAPMDLSELLGAEDAVGDIEDATGALKKLKNVTLGIDELNINAPQEDAASATSGVSLGGLDTALLDQAFNDAFEEYQRVWDEAFSNMENRANEFADKIDVFLQPIKDIFQNIAIGDWFAVGDDVGKLANAIFTFFSDALNSVNWKQIGKNIGSFLAGVNWLEDVILPGLELVGDISEAIADLWFGSFEAAPIETLLFTTFGLLNFTPLGAMVGSKISTAIAGNLSFSAITSAFGAGLSGLFGNQAAISALAFINPITKFFTGIGSVLGGAVMAFTNFFDMLKNGFSWLNEILMVVGIGITAVGAVILGAPALVAGVVAGVVAAVGTLVVVIKDNWETIKATLDKLKLKFVDWADSTKQKISDWGINVGILFGNFVNNTKTNISNWYAETTEKFTNWGINVGMALANFDENARNKFNSFKTNTFGTLSSWYELAKNKISSFKSNTSTFFGNFKANAIETFVQFGSRTYTTLSNWYNDALEFFGIDEWSFDGIKDGLSRSFNSAIEAIKSIWNSFANWLNEKLNFSWNAVTIAGREIVPSGSISLGRVPTFQTGGFPEDGLFMANHNELVGQFSNGRTAVANNEQIVEGIRQGVEDAVASMLAPYLEQIANNTRETADKDFAINIGDRAIARANARGQNSMGRTLMSTT